LEVGVLDLLVEDLHRRGVVGEERTLKLLYLVLTSRLLDYPVSAILKGPSSAGKSFALRRLLEYFPPSAYHVLSSMSKHALVYDSEPLAHRMLILNEDKGLSGHLTACLLRGILSEGKVRYAAVERSKGGTRTRIVERQGPTGFVTTTTDVEIHRETETRMLSIPIADTAHQTVAILSAMVNGAHEAGPDEEWVAFQRWLETAERRVAMPFAERMLSLIPPIAVRLRRDARVLLSLIQTHAIVHQRHRERDSEGRIVATLEDYGVVRELVEEIFLDAAEGAVPKEVREVVTMVDMCEFTYQQTATVQRLARMMKLDKSTVSRRVHKAISMGHLKSVGGRTRVQAIGLGDPLPKQRTLLPEVGALGL
jgi:hypothetical protein